jgi:hypothetical protein
LNEFEYETRHCAESFLCLQEVLRNQLGDILAGLNQDAELETPEWEYIGVGRDDGLEAGEYSPIIYRPAVWELLHWETVWLSKTPETPSKSWDAASARIIIDKISEYSQNKFAKLISGTFLAGDFNSEENQEAYQELTRNLLDAYKQVESSRRYGNYITWTGFGYEDEPASRIDYVLVRPTGAQGQRLAVIGYAVLGNRFDDGVFSSDHRAVIVDLTL